MVNQVTNPANPASELYRSSVEFIARNVPPGAHGWKDALADVENQYGYSPAYDVAYVLASTVWHAKLAGPRPEDRQRIATLKQRAAALKELHAHIAAAVKSGLLACDVHVQPLERNWRPMKLSGKRADWHLDEFVGQIAVILGQARWDPTHGDWASSPMTLDPFGEAFGFGVQLLRSTGVLPRTHKGRRISPDEHRENLRRRFLRIKKVGSLPPPPDDTNPVAWAHAIDRRLRQALYGAVTGSGGRTFVALRDPSTLMLRADTWGALTGKVDRLQCRLFDASFLPHFHRLVPEELLPVAFAALDLLAILQKADVPLCALDDLAFNYEGLWLWLHGRSEKPLRIPAHRDDPAK